jgi:SRSO17 transposase
VFRSDDIDGDLDAWLAPFVGVIGRSTRSKWAPLYLRGLLGPDGPKSVQPIAARLGLPGHDQLHHFVSSPAWDDGPLWRVLTEEADRLVGGDDAVLVIDDTALPKKGTASVGVAGQYCGALGKQANCQSLVSLTLARREVPVPVGLRLFLPSVWTDDPARCAKAGVPEAARIAQTKPQIALAEIDRLMAAGLRFGCVLADAGYGSGAPFRQGLSARGLSWAVGVPRTLKVFTSDVGLLFPRANKGKPRQHAVPSETARDAADVLAGCRWRRVVWRQGTKGALAARFAAVRVRVADGPRSPRHGHLPGEEVWLIGEWRRSGERKYYLSNLPARTTLRHLATAIKARWVCEQAHQQLKQELGLDHFEGRSWTGLHRHALMTCIAFAYLQHLRLKAAGRGEKSATERTAAATDTP